MDFIDTHAHIYSEQFSDDFSGVVNRALEAKVRKIYMPNIDRDSIEVMLELEEKHRDVCVAMMGMHPCSINKQFEKDLYEVEAWLNRRPFVAIGEIGTDLYWDKSLFSYQKEAFKIQCELAIKHKLPVVIHCRESMRETIDLVKELDNPNLYGVFHCFGGTAKEAKEIIEMGFYLGIGGVLTFKNTELREQIKEVDLKMLVLETDSPYLSPVPYRGKRNEPSYIPIVAEKLADVMGVTIDEIAQITTKNAEKLFGAS